MKDKLINKLKELSLQLNGEMNNHRTFYENKTKLDISGSIEINNTLYFSALDEIAKIYGHVNQEENINLSDDVNIGRIVLYKHTGLNMRPPTHSIEFTSLFPNVLLNLYDSNIIKFNNTVYGQIIIDLIKYRDDIKKVSVDNAAGNDDNFEDFILNKITDGNIWYLTKVLINYTYTVTRNKNGRFFITNHSLIGTYTKGVFDELFRLFPDNIVGINVDEIYITNFNDNIKKIMTHFVNKLDVPYTIKPIGDGEYDFRRVRMI